MHGDFGHFEESQLGHVADIHLIRRLAPFLKPWKHLLLTAIILSIVLTGLDLALPYITKETIDRYIVPKRSTQSCDVRENVRMLQVDLSKPGVSEIVAKHSGLFIQSGEKACIPFDRLKSLSDPEIRTLRAFDLSGVAWMSLLFLGLVIFDFALNFLQQVTMEIAAQRIMHDLRMKLLDHLLSLGMSFFNRNPVGRLVTRATSDIQNMDELFTSVVVFVFKDVFLLSGIALMLLIMQWKLALISFAVLPIVVWIAIRFSQLARGAFRTLRVKTAEINSRFSETVSGIRVIQLFRSEAVNFKRFSKVNHEYYLAGMQQLHVFALFMPAIEVLGMTAMALVIFWGGWDVFADRISIGVLVAFISYIKMFFRPIRDIAEKYNILQNAMSSAERLFQIFDEQEGKLPQQGETIRGRIERIEVDDVSFGYIPGELVLKQVSCSLSKGEILAIVGATGSGKTTLIHLLVRLYEPVSGSIRINGRNIREYAPQALRRRIAVVSQDPFLFSESLRENLLHGIEPLPDEALWHILEAAQCRSLVENLPKGLDTVLSEGGLSISSGERQLLSIARAFTRNADLIILDEATSYVDSHTEQLIQTAVENLLKDRTAIVIAHRLVTARSADHILVMGAGRIIESGNHESLMSKQGVYYKLNQLGHSLSPQSAS
ncbi:ABC transporter ATP-binding protein [Desulfatirhabdium butyrativorans]|uniref:ABC transporter ATP-binding protein n=1 Tax=Desulfatirhabdium butyrativorans TaxID=340467 RepID=UPI0004038625|nr:ABC transporter ATP-binding protein [Desulfatirhabdium butyrativorans]